MIQNLISKGKGQTLASRWEKTDRFSWYDILLFVIVAGFCFVSFVHPDIIYTGNRSWIMFDSITGFYDNVHEWTHDYGANYMATTFWLFALWNLPLRLLGFPAPEGVASTGYVLWYKMLPALFFVLSIMMFLKLAREIGMNEKRARVAVYSFITMPIFFYSQFIFSQYDIITIFFMLWGMYCYYRNQKGDMWKSAFLFGIAVTCKYYAVMIFLVLLLIREKKPLQLLKYTAAAFLPIGLEVMMYFQSAGFQASVLHFKVMDYISTTDSTALSDYSFTKVLLVIVIIWAFFVKPENRKEEIAWTLFLCCGCCASLFGLSNWHPQWPMFMVPFLVLSAFINEHLDKFLLGDLFLGLVFQYFVLIRFPGGADVNMMDYLVWSHVFTDGPGALSITNVIPPVSSNTLYSMYLGMLLCMFIFKHPRWMQQDWGQPMETDYMHRIRLSFLAGAGMYIIPAFLTAAINTGMVS